MTPMSCIQAPLALCSLLLAFTVPSSAVRTQESSPLSFVVEPQAGSPQLPGRRAFGSFSAVEVEEESYMRAWDGSEPTAEPDDALFGRVNGFVDRLDNNMGNRSASDLVGVTRNGVHDLLALRSAIVFNLCLCFILVITFEFLRGWYPQVYASGVGHVSKKANQPAGDPPRNSVVARLRQYEQRFFGWTAASAATTSDEVYEKVGLDGLMFLEFHKLLEQVIKIAAPVLIFGLCPMHWNRSSGGDGLSRLNIGALTSQHNVEAIHWWTHVAAVWFVVLVTLWCLFDAHVKIFLPYRYKWLNTLPPPQSTTLMVENIPADKRSEAELGKYFAHLFGKEAISRTYIVRKTRDLRAKIALLDSWSHELRQAEADAQTNMENDDARGTEDIADGDASHSRTASGRAGWCSCLSRSRKSKEYYESKVQEAQSEVEKARSTVELSASLGDPKVCSSSGFVTFTTQRSCRLASREQLEKDAMTFELAAPPAPDDVVYEDLAEITGWWKFVYGLIALGLNLLVFIIWMPLVASASSLSSLPNLQAYLPIFRTICERFPVVESILVGVLATLVLKTFMGFLPTILMYIIRGFLMPKSNAWAQVMLQNRYYVFQVIFVVLVTAIGQSMSRTIQEVVEQPSHVFKLLGESLPESSHFYLFYIVLGWSTVAMELMRQANLMKYVAFSALYNSEEARRRSEPEDQDFSGMGSRMAKAALMATITLTFCTCMPVVLLAAWVYFAFARLSYTYLLVFAETKKPDLGGMFWISAVRHMFVALTLFVSLMVGILSLQRHARLPAVIAALSYFVIFFEARRFESFIWEALPFEEIADMDHAYGKGDRPIAPEDAEEYFQAECRGEGSFKRSSEKGAEAKSFAERSSASAGSSSEARGAAEPLPR